MNLKLLILTILLGITSTSIYSDSNGIWTYPRDIQPGVFGEDESTDYVNDNFTFDHLVYFNNNVIVNSNIGIGVQNPTERLDVNGTILVNELIDRENTDFSLNPFGESILQIIRSDVYYSRGTNQYFLDPKDNSRLNNVNVLGLLQMNGVNINDIFVNENQANSISSAMIIDGTINSNDLSSNSVGGDELITSYETGSVYDSRFVNENQANSVNSNMIVDNSITLNDVNVDNLDNVFATRNYVDENSGKWDENGNKIYYNGGNVGIGRNNPSSKLDVNGRVRATQYCDENGNNCLDTSVGNIITKKLVPPTNHPSHGRQVSSRGLDSALDVPGEVTFYAADQETANFLCREQEGMQFGYWQRVGKPNSAGWAPYHNLAISAYDPTSSTSRNVMCNHGSTCNSGGFFYGVTLYCYSISGLPNPNNFPSFG